MPLRQALIFTSRQTFKSFNPLKSFKELDGLSPEFCILTPGSLLLNPQSEIRNHGLHALCGEGRELQRTLCVILAR